MRRRARCRRARCPRCAPAASCALLGLCRAKPRRHGPADRGHRGKRRKAGHQLPAKAGSLAASAGARARAGAGGCRRRPSVAPAASRTCNRHRNAVGMRARGQFAGAQHVADQVIGMPGLAAPPGRRPQLRRRARTPRLATGHPPVPKSVHASASCSITSPRPFSRFTSACPTGSPAWA